MAKNRLQLDFSIEEATRRRDFLNEYLERDEFKQKPPTEQELETLAKYLLYGKNENGESCVSRGEVQVETKNKTWSNEHNVQSLEFLMDKEEGPGFDENQILKPYQAHYKNIREVFSREEALRKAPDDLKQVFQNLFQQIDETEVIINYYDLKTGKRTKPPRDELLNRFTEIQREDLKEEAERLTQYQYLKKKHILVELRREQYTLRDSYDVRITKDAASAGAPIEDEPIFTFEYDAPVKPLGLFKDNDIDELIFRDFEHLNPSEFTEDELKKISKHYWEKQKEQREINFDFREKEHVYQLFLNYFDLKDCYLNEDISSTTKFLFTTLEFYISQAELSEVQKEILNLKIKKIRNQDIAQYINKKYNKTYTANYISTIFRQKIIKRINEVAIFHEKIISNLFFEEEFKKCTSCGKTFLICSENFVKKSRSRDGYTNRCKNCDKLDRQKKKTN